jgi:hypothetical protein
LVGRGEKEKEGQGIKWSKKHKFVETAEDLQQKQYVLFASQQTCQQAGRA